jgi:hypothetical protein
MFSTVQLQYLTIAILLFSTLWSAVDSQPNAVGQEAKRYVYKVVDVPAGSHAAMQSTLNEYGSAGWELVVIGIGDMTTPRLVFKK